MVDGDWKLIEDLEDGSLRLFNVAEDIGEQNDLAKAHPERMHAMVEKLHEWKMKVEAIPMTKNPNFDPEKFAQQQKHAHTVRKESLETFHRNLVHPPNSVTPGEPVTYRSSAFKTKK